MSRQAPRIAVSAGVAAGLLLVDAVALVLGSAVPLGGVMGAGMGALGSATLAMALADGGMRQLDTDDGVLRSGLLWLALGGLLWASILIGMGDAAAIPAVAALLWLAVQVALFTEAEDDGDAEADDD